MSVVNKPFVESLKTVPDPFIPLEGNVDPPEEVVPYKLPSFPRHTPPLGLAPFVPKNENKFVINPLVVSLKITPLL